MHAFMVQRRSQEYRIHYDWSSHGLSKLVIVGSCFTYCSYALMYIVSALINFTTQLV